MLKPHPGAQGGVDIDDVKIRHIGHNKAEDEPRELHCGWLIRHDAHEIEIFDTPVGKCNGWDVK